jgi:hypothetical protein
MRPSFLSKTDKGVRSMVSKQTACGAVFAL